jgi:hypothetical protein
MASPAVLLDMLTRTAACFAILLMALCSGCAPESGDVQPPVSDDVFLYVDSATAPDAAYDAAERWEKASGLVFAFAPDALPVVIADVETVRTECGDPGAHACTMVNRADRGVGGFYFREDWLDDPNAGNIWTHEFGHAALRRYGDDTTMGVQHHSIPGVMVTWWNDEAKITEELLSLVCEYNDCTTFVPE